MGSEGPRYLQESPQGLHSGFLRPWCTSREVAGGLLGCVSLGFYHKLGNCFRLRVSLEVGFSGFRVRYQLLG